MIIKNFNIIIFKIVVFIIILNTVSYANWKTDRENLNNVYISNHFRIFYTLQGKNAVANQNDTNKNNIPDIIENIALQLNTSEQLFTNILGFKSPLQSNRYKNLAKSIDIHILALNYKGESGDGVIKYNYKIIQKNHQTLSMAISNKIKANNLTPLHELFHTYQNGYTMFKNRWFTEGTARWSEFAFKNKTGKQHNLPSTALEIEKLLYKTYDAKYFWNRLLFLCSKKDKGFKLSNNLKNNTYIGSDEKIIKDNTLFGYTFLISFFKNLDIADDIAANKFGYKKFQWKEKKQKSFKNNKYILKALKKTISENRCQNIKEVEYFITAIDKYLKNKDSTKDLTNKIKNLGIAYKDIYKSGEDIYSRNIWDMKFYNNLLYIAAGNSSNSHPSPNSGPVPIINYNPNNKSFNSDGKVYDEQIDLFRILKDKLYIPGHDSSKKQSFGNIYEKDHNLKWKSFYNIPNALHVFDIINYDNKLFAAISTHLGAAIAISNDSAKTWEIVQIGSRQRVYSLLMVNNKLYAIKQSLSPKKKKKLTKKELANYNLVFEYKNNKFIPRDDLNIKKLYQIKNSKKTIRISKSEIFKNKSIYIAAYNYINPFAIFIVESFNKNDTKIRKVNFPFKCKPRDILIREDFVYFLCTVKFNKIFKNIVFRSKFGNLTKPKELFSFKTKAFARSFEKFENDFYFGLGCDVKNKKKWKQKELKIETGTLIKITQENI